MVPARVTRALQAEEELLGILLETFYLHMLYITEKHRVLMLNLELHGMA